jgi:S1-C subfamily serine protease
VVAGVSDSLLKVVFHDGQEIPARIVRVAKDVDLALLKIDSSGLTPMNVLDQDQEAELGDGIFTIGTPQSIELGQSVTKGIISGFRKAKGVSFLQTDMSINAGNSGGAMITEDGLVRGVVASRLVGFGVEGIGFGIPSYLIFKELGMKYKN